METTINIHPITDHLSVAIRDHDGKIIFVLISTNADGVVWEEIITEEVAAAMCLTPDSPITHQNWADWCDGVFSGDSRSLVIEDDESAEFADDCDRLFEQTQDFGDD